MWLINFASEKFYFRSIFSVYQKYSWIHYREFQIEKYCHLVLSTLNCHFSPHRKENFCFPLLLQIWKVSSEPEMFLINIKPLNAAVLLQSFLFIKKSLYYTDIIWASYYIENIFIWKISVTDKFLSYVSLIFRLLVCTKIFRNKT